MSKLLKATSKFLNILNIPVTKDIVKDIFSEILDNLKPQELSEFLEKISPVIDKEIIRISKKENLTPNGGELKLFANKEKEDIILEWDFYFTDEKKQIIKKSSNRIVSGNLFTKEAIEIIKNQSPLYQIEPPSV